MINIGVIGCGYWGPNHVRVFSQLDDSNVVAIADNDVDRLEQIKQNFPQVEVCQNYKDIYSNPKIDAVCIATPTETHFELAKEALKNNKHVLCEKPLALTVRECLILGEIAKDAQKILMVGHVFVFNAGITWLKQFIQSGALGQIYYAYSMRTNLGPFRYDVNALWDLAPHDISIFNYLFDAEPENVSARGQKSLGTSLEDIAYVSMEYPNNILANMHVSWLDPKKIRQITIVGEKNMVVWDDLDQSGPIKLYDKHVSKSNTYYNTFGEFQLLSQEGSTTIPYIKAQEPLKLQNQYFLDAIQNRSEKSVVDADHGRAVVNTLCAIQESINLKGQCIDL